MSNIDADAAPARALRRIETSAQGAALIAHLGEVLDALLRIVEEETELVRASRLGHAAQLEPRKSELARLYLADSERLKTNAVFLAANLPRELADLRRRHDLFRALLQINLTVLATAHAVSEGIIRGVMSELGRKAAPQTYCPSGRPAAASPGAAKPLRLSRSL